MATGVSVPGQRLGGAPPVSVRRVAGVERALGPSAAERAAPTASGPSGTPSLTQLPRCRERWAAHHDKPVTLLSHLLHTPRLGRPVVRWSGAEISRVRLRRAAKIGRHKLADRMARSGRLIAAHLERPRVFSRTRSCLWHSVCLTKFIVTQSLWWKLLFGAVLILVPGSLLLAPVVLVAVQRARAARQTAASRVQASSATESAAAATQLVGA